MPDQIFISYRRGDAAYVTGHINDLLRKEFGDAAVFTDVDNIALGVDFRAVLDETVSQCKVLLAVIGSEWFIVKNQDGQRRLDDPADFVRIEIESALQRDIPVIPLLVSGAKMPAPEELPESLRGLAFRNGTQIRPAPDFSADMARLIKNLRRHFEDEPAAAGPGPDSEPTEKRSRAKADVQRDTAAKRGKASGVQVEVEEEDRARHRAELGIGQQQRKKRWATRLGLLAVVILAGAAWFFVEGNQETEPNIDVSDDAEANLTDDTVGTGEAETGDPTEVVLDPVAEAVLDLEAEAVLDPVAEAAEGLSAGATFEPADGAQAVPETESDATENLTVDTTDESVDDAVPTPELAVEDAVDESVDEVEASIAASDDAALDTDAGNEAAPAPDAQHQPSAPELISEGVRLAAIGEHEAAIQNFDVAIQLKADQSFFYNQRGTSYQALGQYEAAIKDYDEAIRLNGEDVNAYYRRAASHYSLENFSAAVTDFNVVIQLDPEFVNAYSRRADAHEALGDAEAAARDRATVAELNAN